MKKFMAAFSVALILAVGVLAGGPSFGHTSLKTGKACSATGWYVASVGTTVYDSYYNYALGGYYYIAFETFVISSSDNCIQFGETTVWDTAGSHYGALNGGVLHLREGFPGSTYPSYTPVIQYQWKTILNGSYMYSSPADAWADNYTTYAQDNYGGWHGYTYGPYYSVAN